MMASLASSQPQSSWAGIAHMDQCQQTLRPRYRSGSGEEVGQKRVMEGGRLFGSTSGWGPWIDVQLPVCGLGAVVSRRTFHLVEVWGLRVTHG